MSSSTSLNGSDDVAEECNDNVGSDVYLVNDDRLLDDDDDLLEDPDKPDPEPDTPRPCLNRTGVVVVGAAVVGVFVVIGVIVVVVLSVLSLHSSSKVGRHSAVDAAAKVTSAVPSSSVQPSKSVLMLALGDNCTTRLVGRVEHGVRSFKGIPYAVAPVGKLRWQEAIPLSEDTNCPSELNADRYGSRCVQLDSGSTLTGSEDCLFMNIWTPADVDLSSSRLDVMVHIHDGGLMTGSGHEPSGLPSSDLVQSANIVLVGFNYRLNVFGFLALDILSSTDTHGSSGNYGLMDQITALRWVQQHISSFGGNPNKVTVFGSGSGATSISTLLASRLSLGLFSQAWLSNPSPKPQRSLMEAELQNEAFYNETVCAANGTDAVQQAECLRGLNVDTLMSVFPWQAWLNEHFYWIPSPAETSTVIAIVDGRVAQRSTLAAWQQSSFSNIPLLISSADQASDVKLMPRSLNKWYEMKYVDYIKQRFQPFVDNSDIQSVERILRLYSVNSSTAATPELCVTSLVSDIRATCPLDEMARVAASVSQSPLYRFQVDYHSAVQPLSDTGRNYAYRGIDVDAFFNSSCPSGADESTWSSLVDNIRHVVVQFVSSGTVTGWETFPHASYDISTIISNATTPRYLSNKCIYWRKHGFFPVYAWMN